MHAIIMFTYNVHVSSAQLHVSYENGEKDIVEIKNAEPDNDLFEPPAVGEVVCCKAKNGGRYRAVIDKVKRSNEKVCALQLYVLGII